MSWAEFRAALSIIRPEEDELEVSDDIRPTLMQPVVAIGRGGVTVTRMRWDFIPSTWTRPVREKTFSTINARIEGVATSQAFSNAWRRNQKCLVPASGWYEWVNQPGRNSKTKLAIRHALRDWFCMAGLWERAIIGGEQILSFTVLTTGAEGDLAAWHDRSPYPLDPEQARAWLGSPPGQIPPSPGLSPLSIVPVDSPPPSTPDRLL